MKIKLCGLMRPCDIEAVNELQPDYIGFVFAKKSRRYVSPEKAEKLKAMLAPGIQAVGVFVNSRRRSYHFLRLEQLMWHSSMDRKARRRSDGFGNLPIIR